MKNKIIIVAAGTGSRLGPLTKTTPKPLVEYEKGKTILGEALEQINASEVIHEVTLVVGYLASQIEGWIDANKDKYKNLKISTVYNPYYEDSGNLHSLWFAEGLISGNCFITNADNIIHRDVFVLMAKETSSCLAVCENDNLREDDMKAYVEGDEVVDVNKDIQQKDGILESVSLVRVVNQDTESFVQVLNGCIRNEIHKLDYWPIIFNKLYKSGTYVKPVKIDKDAWHEIDYHGDIIDLIQKQGKK